MKGYGIQALVPIAILFVVAFFIFGIGSTMINDLSENFCEDHSGTWITNTTIPASASAVGVNPTTGVWLGCCATVTGSANNCTAWETTITSLNTSGQGLESMEELADWGPTLALVVIASIIIGVLITYLARGRGA